MDKNSDVFEKFAEDYLHRVGVDARKLFTDDFVRNLTHFTSFDDMLEAAIRYHKDHPTP